MELSKGLGVWGLRRMLRGLGFHHLKLFTQHQVPSPCFRFLTQQGERTPPSAPNLWCVQRQSQVPEDLRMRATERTYGLFIHQSLNPSWDHPFALSSHLDH